MDKVSIVENSSQNCVLDEWVYIGFVTISVAIDSLFIRNHFQMIFFNI